MMIYLNHADVQRYKESVGIKKHYTGPLKQLAELEFPDKMRIKLSLLSTTKRTWVSMSRTRSDEDSD